MAEVLELSRSRYYAWLRSPANAHERRDQELGTLITTIFHQKRRRYGSPRVFEELKKQGQRSSEKRVARLMRTLGLQAQRKQRFQRTTESDHPLPVAANVVARQFAIEQLNTVWASDITYIWTWEGWLYQCVILDLASRKVVGWSLGEDLSAALTRSALQMAVLHRQPKPGLLFHSDQGIQYAAEDFRQDLANYHMRQSMSRKGNCWDNACAESFFATMKREEVGIQVYKTRQEARERIFEYIAVFYNRQRIHSSLGFLSPDEYEAQIILSRKAA